MSRLLFCGACGDESYDVAMRIVETPEEERRVVPVYVGETAKGEQPVPLEVPEVYVREPRCRDVKACQERIAAFEKTAR